MKTAEDVLNDHNNSYSSGLDYDEVVGAMKDYAKQVSERSLKEAAMNAAFDISLYGASEKSCDDLHDLIIATPIETP